MSFLPMVFTLVIRALRKRDGAVALEFALVSAPFVFLMFAIMELGLMFVTNINLSNATLQLARQIRTGSIIAPGSAAGSSSGISMSLTDFKRAICANLSMVPSSTCTAQLQVDVRSQSSFGQLAANPVSGNTFNNASLCYYSGSSGSIVEFRVYYLWPVITPLLLSALVNVTTYKSGSSTTAGTYYVLQSADAFRIEPNSSGTNSGSGC